MNRSEINFIILKYLYDNNYLIDINEEMEAIQQNIINESDLYKVSENIDNLLNSLLTVETKETLKDIFIAYIHNNIFFNASDSLTQQLRNIETVFNEFNKINFTYFKLNHIIINEGEIYTTWFDCDSYTKYQTININNYKLELLHSLESLETEDIILIMESIL